MKGLYEPLGGNHYQKIREKFCQAIKKDSTAVFCSNKQIVYSADSTLPFEQSRDLFYLCGIDQENTFLILSPNNPNPELREVLFIEKSTQQSLIWEGRKLTKKQAQKLSGIETIFWSEDFEKISKQILGKSKNIYLNQNDHPRNSAPIELDFSFLFNQQIKKKFPKAKYILADEILKNLRSIKTKVEIKQIQTAGKITEIGYKKVLPLLKNEIWEFEIMAEFSAAFLKERAGGFAYHPIVASGKNACILHYTQNNQKCKKGDMVLLDVAANYGNYASDITRSVPVGGKFSARQKLIYQAVLRLKKFAETLLVEGNTFEQYNKEIGDFATSLMLEIGLINKVDVQKESKNNRAYRKYFMHGTSHFLGLDTHDVGDYNKPFEKNMVFTIEPGIYLPKEKLGIRLEDNYVVQKKGEPKNLTSGIPLEISEIEDLILGGH